MKTLLPSASKPEACDPRVMKAVRVSEQMLLAQANIRLGNVMLRSCTCTPGSD